MMTHRPGIELGKKLAAIAPVIANLPEKISGRSEFGFRDGAIAKIMDIS